MGKQRRIRVMGIINLTDNSYYAASRHLDAKGRPMLKQVETDVARMLEEGADIIDIGACSTRPGAAAVGAKEEWRRLESVLPLIAERFPDICISIDTYWSEVALKAAAVIKAENLIINDISAGARDPQMLETVAGAGLGYIAMHSHGETTDKLDYPGGVTACVKRYFEDFALKAEAAGLRDWVLDPGFGFNKSVEENWELLRGMSSLKGSYGGRPREILVGISRKSMLYKPLGITPEEALPATCEAHRLALEEGADILRVHDVAAAVGVIDEHLGKQFREDSQKNSLSLL